MAASKQTKASQPEEPWQVTVTTARAQLGSKGYAFATEINSRQELQEVMQNLSVANMKRGVPKFFVRMSPFIANIDSFTTAIDVFVSSKPDVAALVWGTLKVILTAAIRYIDILTLIVQMFADMETRLPRLESYHKTFAGAHRMEEQLARLYHHYILFCISTIKFLSKRQCWAFIRLSWGKEREVFRSTIAQLDYCRAEIEWEAGATHYQLSAERHEELKTLYSTTHPIPSHEVASLPCRCIAFAKNPHFFERPDISDRIEDHLGWTQSSASSEPKQLRSFVLHGMGGVGKTQIIQDFAYRHWNDYQAILWVTADTRIKIAKEYSDMAHNLGISNVQDQNTSRKALKRWLETTDESWLLIFDNADDPDMLNDYWPSCTSGHILMTSRNYQSKDITTGECEVDVLSTKDGSSMLYSLLRLEDARAQQQIAEKLSDELGGLPLALSQMSGYMMTHGYSMSQFLKFYRTGDTADELARSTTSLNHYQYKKTLETCWQISLTTLEQDAKCLVGLCAFLDPDEIAESLFTEGSSKLDGYDYLKKPVTFNRTVEELMREALLKRNHETSSLSIHRQVKRSALKTMSDVETIKNFRLAMQLLYNVYPRQSPLGEPIPDWPRCAKYTSHVLAIHQEFEFRADLLTPIAANLLTELFCDCGVYLWAQGQYKQSEALASTSIRLAEVSLADYDPLRAQPWTLMGCIYIRVEGRLSLAIECLETALRIRQKHSKVVHKDTNLPLEDDIQLANSLSNLAVVKKQSGDYAEAALLQEQCLSIKKKYPLDQMAFLLALSYDNLGRIKELQSEFEAAYALFKQGYSLLKIHSKEVGTHHRMAQFTCSLARMEAKLGLEKEAEDHLWESMKLYQETVGVSHTDAALTSYHLGTLLLRRGAFDDAKLPLEAAKEVFSHPLIRSPAKLAATYHRLYELYTKNGNTELAIEAKDSSMRVWAELTKSPEPMGTLDEIASKFEALNTTD